MQFVASLLRHLGCLMLSSCAWQVDMPSAAAHIPFSGANPPPPLQLQTPQMQHAAQQQGGSSMPMQRQGSASLPQPQLPRMDAPLTFMMVRAPGAIPPFCIAIREA